jgi:hypothetical protein
LCPSRFSGRDLAVVTEANDDADAGQRSITRMRRAGQAEYTPRMSKLGWMLCLPAQIPNERLSVLGSAAGRSISANG